MERSSGILLHISSLPSPYGIGTLGKEAYRFADNLKAANQKYWQLLPLGPTSYGDSPYQSFSTFAGNPYFIDLDLLVKDGLLHKKDLEGLDWGDDPAHVDYGKIYEGRFPLLYKAYQKGWERDKEEVAAFQKEKRWLHDYAFFMALKRYFNMQSWMDWEDEDIRQRKSEAMAKYEALLEDDIRFFTYLQFLFFRQWTALKEYISSWMSAKSPKRSPAFPRITSVRTVNCGVTPSTTMTR